MKKITFNAWAFATIALFTMIILRVYNPDIFWDIINAFIQIGATISEWFK